MSVAEHQYPIPTEDDLKQMVGAATPHFALQIRDRVRDYAASLPADHARQAEMAAHVEYLERLAYTGEHADEARPDLPPRPSLRPPDGTQAR
ncbi:MAG TPA: hypothetical protein VKD47_03105 [Miltoncostaeaceae bacterium]|nr:hypothetical protein [Miltoncostaeaceae bacterium]